MSHLSAHFYTRSSQSHKSSLKFGKSLLQLGRINHCEYIPAVLVQIKVTTAALKRQQQDKPLKKTKNKRKATDRSLIQPSVRNVEETAGDGSYTRDAEGFSPAAELVSEAGGAQPEPSVAFLGVVLLLPLQCTWCHFDLCGLFFLSFTDSGSDCRNQAFT